MKYFILLAVCIGAALAVDTCGYGTEIACPENCLLTPVVTCVGDAGSGYYAVFNYYNNCTDYIISLPPTTTDEIRFRRGSVLNDTVQESPYAVYPPSDLGESTEFTIELDSKDVAAIWTIGQWSVTARWAGVDTCDLATADANDVNFNIQEEDQELACTLDDNSFLRNIASGYGAVSQIYRNSNESGNSCFNMWVRYMVVSGSPDNTVDVCLVNGISSFESVPILVCQAVIESQLPGCCTQNCDNANCTAGVEPPKVFTCDPKDAFTTNTLASLANCIKSNRDLGNDCNTTIIDCFSVRFGSFLITSIEGQNIYSCGFNQSQWYMPACGLNQCYQKACDTDVVLPSPIPPLEFPHPHKALARELSRRENPS